MVRGYGLSGFTKEVREKEISLLESQNCTVIVTNIEYHRSCEPPPRNNFNKVLSRSKPVFLSFGPPTFGL